MAGTILSVTKSGSNTPTESLPEEIRNRETHQVDIGASYYAGSLTIPSLNQAFSVFDPAPILEEEIGLVGDSGKGGTSKVFRGSYGDRQVCAIKVMDWRALLGRSPDYIEDYLRKFGGEGRDVQTMFRRCSDDPRLARIIQVHKYGSYIIPHIIMEFVDGTDLDNIVLDRTISTNLTPGLSRSDVVNNIYPRAPVSTMDEVHQLLRSYIQSSEGLELLHEQSIIHRDIKPANILVDRSGNIRITDLGLVKSLDTERVRTKGTIIGTPVFMSPEQINMAHNIRELTVQSDTYSFGGTMFYTLTGQYAHSFSDADTSTTKAMCIVGNVAGIKGFDILSDELGARLEYSFGPIKDWCLEYDPVDRPTTKARTYAIIGAAVELGVEPEHIRSYSYVEQDDVSELVADVYSWTDSRRKELVVSGLKHAGHTDVMDAYETALNQTAYSEVDTSKLKLSERLTLAANAVINIMSGSNQ